MLCSLIFIHEWRELQFKVDSERQIVKKLSEFLPEICWEEIPEEIFFFHIWFRCLTWDTDLDFTSNKPTHYPLDYSDFQMAWIRIIKRSKKVSIESFVFTPNQQRLITTSLHFNKTNVSNKLREYFNNKNLKLNKI